jgi:endonuclease/exonuclease/phosphatase (EEP) superfamily protein YafD
MVMSNVQAENQQYDRWMQVVTAEDPDLILAVEINDAWQQVLSSLRDRYPHMVARPQDNYYGMTLLSKLPLIDPRVRFVVQDDIPSIHTGVQLRSGEVVHVVGVHPRPPEPVRDVDATPRDAELVVIGRQLDEVGRPCIIAGDLNDVAWSFTTDLFLRISGLLDPRVGRGMFNSYNAKNPLFRFPLDHVFHSNAFRMVDLRRLDAVGSDHFPMLIELSYEPKVQREQPEPEEDLQDERKAQDLIDQEEQEEQPVHSEKAHPQSLKEEAS